MIDFSFPREARLLTGADYTRLFSKSSIHSGNAHYLLLAMPNDLGRARLGLVVARKHLKRAVDRNRVKRTVRESFRHQKNNLAGLDIVFIARRGIGDLLPDHLWSHINRAWPKLLAKSPSPGQEQKRN